MKVIDKPLSINPLKKSQILGAVTAFLGVNGCMPLVHGSQGCMAFTKNFLTQHYREITPMQSTAIYDIATIIGDDNNLHEGIANVIEKQNPDIIGVVTSGLSETRGDDIKGAIVRFREKFPQYDSKYIVPVSTPDFKGDSEMGFGKAVASIIETIAEPSEIYRVPDRKRVNILAGMHLTAGDSDWLRRLFEDFDLDVFILPDLASSMGGQVNRYYGLPEEGSSLRGIKSMGSADFTIAIGRSMEISADRLLEKCEIPYKLFDSLTGVKASDELLSWLIEYTDKPAPDWVKVERQRAIDSMLDAHFNYGGRSCSIAAEPDLLYSLGTFITKELGISIDCAVSSVKSELLDRIEAGHKLVGDLYDLEESSGESDFVLGNSNCVPICQRVGKPLFKVGYPIKDMLGHFHRTFIGYRGAMELAFALGNICLNLDIDKSHEIGDMI